MAVFVLEATLSHQSKMVADDFSQDTLPCTRGPAWSTLPRREPPPPTQPGHSPAFPSPVEIPQLKPKKARSGQNDTRDLTTICVFFGRTPLFRGSKRKPKETTPFWGSSEKETHPNIKAFLGVKLEMSQWLKLRLLSFDGTAATLSLGYIPAP